MDVTSVVRVDLAEFVDDHRYLHTWMSDAISHEVYRRHYGIGPTESLLIDIGNARDVTWDPRLLELFGPAAGATVIGSDVRGVMVATSLLRTGKTGAEDVFGRSAS